VARREHGAGHVERTRCEVQQVGRGQPQVDDVHAARGRTLGERGGEGRRGEAAVTADRHPGCARPLRERGADPARNVLIELVGNDPSDVVRLEDTVEIGVR
jgi:hypothetical protein